MSKIVILVYLSFISLNCYAQNKQEFSEKKSNQGQIIEEFLKKGAWKYHFLSKEWGQWIDRGIQKDSTISLLWQQKALPFWKQKKYKLAISCYDRAVELDRKRWLSRLAFLKCIFAKDYQGALVDLKSCKKEFGSSYQQDHSTEFYMAICYLQTNQYQKALTILKEKITEEEKEKGKAWIHFLDRFYLAISFYELAKYEEAILEFDKVLKEYPTFSDAQYYKSLCLKETGEKEFAQVLIKIAKSNYAKGYTFNEDSSKYEDYPYQVTWQWDSIEYIMK